MIGAPTLPQSVQVRFEPYGDRAHLAAIEHVDPAQRASLLEYLRAHPSVADALLTEHHALVVPHDAQHFPAEHTLPFDDLAARDTRHFRVAVRWNGADLAEAARVLAVPPAELPQRYMAQPYTVSFLGFLPGFAYLRGLPPGLELPRRATVRPSVPARSLAVGGPYLGIYPEASPGGWWLLGEALDVELFARSSPDAGPLYRVGDVITLVEAPR